MTNLAHILEIVAARGTDMIVIRCEGEHVAYFDGWVGELRAKIASRAKSGSPDRSPFLRK